MTHWRKCTAERYDEMLGVLPPERMSGWGFLVGEPASHRLCAVSHRVRADYAAFQRIAGQHYEGPNMTVPEWLELSPGAVLEAMTMAEGTQPDPIAAAMVSECAELLEQHGDHALGDL